MKNFYTSSSGEGETEYWNRFFKIRKIQYINSLWNNVEMIRLKQFSKKENWKYEQVGQIFIKKSDLLDLLNNI